MIVYKTNINKLKKVEIIPTILSDHNGMKLEINKRKVRESTIMWKLNNTLLSNNLVKEEIKEGKLIFVLKQMKMEIQHI